MSWLDKDDADSNFKYAKIFPRERAYVKNMKLGQSADLVKGVASDTVVSIEPKHYGNNIEDSMLEVKD